MNNENPHPWLAGPSDPDLAAWEAYLKALRDQLQSNWTRAKTAYLALKKVREGLGLPFIDDSGMGEVGGSSSAWTSDLQIQTEDLQALVTLIVAALDDVINGKRKMLWDQKNSFFVVEALPSDLLRLELTPNGVPVLVDVKTGKPTHVSGTIGIPNFVYVATVTTSVLALPVYFVVDAAVNTLTDVAEQRTMQVIANRQFDCVQSGKCTPDQAAALTKAVFSGAAGVREAKAKEAAEKGKPTSDLADAAKTLGWVALGLGVLYAVVRLIPAGALGGGGGVKLLPAGPAANPSPSPMSGYAFEHEGKNWKASRDDNWDIIMYTPTGRERFLGTRYVDGSKVNVWVSDGRHIAQLEHMTRGTRANPVLQGTSEQSRNIYRDMVYYSKQYKMPEAYRTDLTKHDRDFLRHHKGEPFGWILYRHGTHLMRTPRGVRGVARDRAAIRDVAEWARADAPEAKFFVWDGASFREEDREGWVSTLQEFVKALAA